MLVHERQRSAILSQFFLCFFVCFFYRLSPWHLPNVEPILAVTMPLAARYGKLSGLLFAFANIFVYDMVTSGMTQWTFVAGLTYACIGFAGPLFFSVRHRALSYAPYAFFATLFFDAITGVVAGSVLFGLSWKVGLVGQIPFTINHLIGNTLLALSVSPLVDYFISQPLTRRSSAYSHA